MCLPKRANEIHPSFLDDRSYVGNLPPAGGYQLWGCKQFCLRRYADRFTLQQLQKQGTSSSIRIWDILYGRYVAAMFEIGSSGKRRSGG